MAYAALPNEEVVVVLILQGPSFLVGPALDISCLLNALLDNPDISMAVIELVTTSVVYRAQNVWVVTARLIVGGQQKQHAPPIRVIPELEAPVMNRPPMMTA